MQGNNSLNLCTAEMIAAVQYYFENVLFKVAPKVTRITFNGGNSPHALKDTFEITVEEKK